MIYDLIIIAKRLQPYFQSHSIIVLIDQPLKSILQMIDILGHLAKWAIEIGELNIEYKPRFIIKAQVIVDFIMEYIIPNKEREKKRNRKKS